MFLLWVSQSVAFAATTAVFEYSQIPPRELAAERGVCSVLWKYVTWLFSLHLQED